MGDVGPTDPVFVEYFNQTATALVRLSGFVAVALTTAMLTATRTGAVRGPTAPTFSMGVLDWNAFVPGARDRITRVRAHGENSAVLVVEINNLEEINITYGAPSGDEAIRTLAAFLRDQLYPTTIIGHRGAGRFVLVGIAATPQDTERRAVELLDALVRVRVSGRTGFRLGVSIGTSDSFAEEHAFDELFAAASAACQRARTGVGGRVQTSAVDGSERRSGELAGAGIGRPRAGGEFQCTLRCGNGTCLQLQRTFIQGNRAVLQGCRAGLRGGDALGQRVRSGVDLFAAGSHLVRAVAGLGCTFPQVSGTGGRLRCALAELGGSGCNAAAEQNKEGEKEYEEQS